MRIAIVNDALIAVEAMRRVITHNRKHQLAWVAFDGAEAVERCATDTPDLILMDLMMPKMDGVEATRNIMAYSPCAIVVVTADVSNNCSRVFEAMGAGALDAVNTPVMLAEADASGGNALLAKIETIRRLLAGKRTGKSDSKSKSAHFPSAPYRGSLVVVGASAGGPAALAKILAQLGRNFPAPIIIVQHVDSQFARGLADWLDCQTKLEVRVAHEGDSPAPGTVLLAGTDEHLIFASQTRLAYSSHPADCACHPSIDVFFKSVERHWKGDVVGLLLTGMGRDGAEGLRSLRARGHHTIAQDQESSAVYGMPKAAAELNAASETLPLDKIGSRLTNILAKNAKVNV